MLHSIPPGRDKSLRSMKRRKDYWNMTDTDKIIKHLKAIWELAEESCPGGLLLLSVHKDENEIRYMINNCAYPHSDDKGPDIATPIDIYYCESI